MPYDFTLTAVIPAAAMEIYDAWLDSLAHSKMTGGPAKMSDEIGAEVTAWDGYITGRNLELVPGERIVQSWRTTQFTDQHADSTITITLEEIDGGTLLTLVHANVPDGQTGYEQGGWQKSYFKPMSAYFAGKGASTGKKAKVAAPRTKRKPARAAAKTAASKTKRKRAAAAKPKRGAPKAKAARAGKKTKRPAKAKPKRAVKTRPKRAARAKRRPARGK